MVKNNVLFLRNSAKPKLISCNIHHTAWKKKEIKKEMLSLSSTSQYLQDYSYTTPATQSNLTAYTRMISPLQQAAWILFERLAHLLHASAKIYLNLQLTLKLKPLSNS